MKESIKTVKTLVCSRSNNLTSTRSVHVHCSFMTAVWMNEWMSSKELYMQDVTASDLNQSSQSVLSHCWMLVNRQQNLCSNNIKWWKWSALLIKASKGKYVWKSRCIHTHCCLQAALSRLVWMRQVTYVWMTLSDTDGASNVLHVWKGRRRALSLLLTDTPSTNWSLLCNVLMTGGGHRCRLLSVSCQLSYTYPSHTPTSTWEPLPPPAYTL